jgi:hypothetical protein
MSFPKKDSIRLRQSTDTTDRRLTGTLDGTTTTETVFLSVVAEKVTVQSTDTLAGDVTFSCNGVDFFVGVSFVANTPISYSTHNVIAVRATRTGGSGKLSILSK